ncbi:MAG: CorA family divalent cation transporter [Candidatus Bilamarchaeaceae archaeon]
MIEKFTNFEDFKAAALVRNITGDLESLHNLDILFYEDYEDKYMIISFPAINDTIFNQMLILSDDFNLAYCSETKRKPLKIRLSKVKRRKFVESTLLAYEVLNSALDSYYAEHANLAKQASQLYMNPDIDQVEILFRKARNLYNVADDVLRLCIEAEDEGLKYIDLKVIPYEFDVLMARARHLVDRMDSFKREVDVLRTKCDIAETKKLSKRVEVLTQIMAVLTVISLIISVPNTIATIFGIPAVSDVFTFDFIMEMVIVSSLLALVASYFYVRGVL